VVHADKFGIWFDERVFSNDAKNEEVFGYIHRESHALDFHMLLKSYKVET